MPTSDGTTAETPDLVGQAMRIAFDGASPRIATPLPSHIGPYRVKGWLGEGGMGVVYEAEQAHPQRSVAVKVIREDLVNPRLIARFQREAEVLGQLTHAGIATVFESGTWTEGPWERPFIAMEMIAGEELTSYAEQNGLDTRGRLELLAQVCDAVEHAHRHGFIHRDLKPSNILVLPGGQPKVLDFGLARAVLPDQLAASASVSAEGAVVGTPLYMSPEQLAGGAASVDTRSDIYSLGVVMFQLLSGRLPYDLPPLPAFQDIRAAIVEKAPLRLAQLDKRFKGDLSTIVAKMLEKDPQDRYQSAGELAADIRRVLAGEPITASHASVLARAWRFCRRNPAIATLTAAVVVLLLACAIGGPILAFVASEAQRHAETQAAETRETLDYLAEVSAEKLDGTQPIAAVRTEMLTRVLKYYERAVLADSQGADVTLAQAHFQLGYLNKALGRCAEARASYEKALSIYGEMIRREPANVYIRRCLAQTFNNLGLVELAQDRVEQAREMLKQAKEQLEALAALEPESDEVAKDLAVNLENSGICSDRQGQQAEAEAQYQAALGNLATLAAKHPEDASLQARLASLHVNRGHVYDDMGRFAEAKVAYDSAVEIFTRLVAARPDSPEAMRGLGASYGYLGLAFRHQGKPQEGIASLRKGIGILRDLVERFPLQHEYRDEFGRALHNLGFALVNLGRPDEAESALAEAVRERRRLVRIQETNVTWQRSLANSLVYLGVSQAMQDRPAEATANQDEAVAILQRVVASLPRDIESRRVLRLGCVTLGESNYAIGRLEAVVAACELGLQQHEVLAQVRVSPDDTYEFAQIHTTRARALADLGRHSEAVGSYDIAAQNWSKLERDTACYHAACAWALAVPLVDDGNREEFIGQALKALRRAVELGFADNELMKNDPDLQAVRQDVRFQEILRHREE